MTMLIIENVSKACFMFQPMNMVEIPKNNKLKPTIIDTNSDENIGNSIKTNPKMIDRIPALLLIM